MQRIRLFAMAIMLIIALARPAVLLSQDNSANETYQGDPVCRPSGRAHSAHLIQQTEPKYDEKDRKKKIEGTVTLSLIVAKDGQAADIKVIKSLTPGLDQQAIKAVSQWKFEPATKDGQPCPSRVDAQLNFHLY